MRVVVITLAHGRHEHLARQVEGLQRSEQPAEAHVVVAMDDPGVAAVVPGADVVDVPLVGGALPLAAARNAGAARATALGADLLVALDVDCVPHPRALGRYAKAARTHDGVLCGPVGYLPAGRHPLEAMPALARPHPARPVPDDDDVLPSHDPDLFWSLSFATTPRTWELVGGFCEDYVGYGGEDTDFARAFTARGVPMHWVGGAWAYHQHHGDTSPVDAHLDDLLRNANLFRERWGEFPMRGWLQQASERGLAQQHGDRWVRA